MTVSHKTLLRKTGAAPPAACGPQFADPGQWGGVGSGSAMVKPPSWASLVGGPHLWPHSASPAGAEHSLPVRGPQLPSVLSQSSIPLLLQYVGAPVAYVQQIFVKSSVSPWHKNLLAVDVFRSPLSRAFQLVEEVRNHVLRDR